MSTERNGSTPPEAHARKFNEAMEARICMPASLIAVLDGAARTGILPQAEELARDIAALNEFDGLMPCGHRLWDAEELGWCTIRHHYGWGLPTAESLDLVEEEARARGGRIVEVGCGSGYWAAVLAARGIEVVACDTGEWKVDRWERKWHPVLGMDGAEAVRRCPGVPVLMVWPDTSDVGVRVADAMEPGRLLLRVGADDCTGGRAFNLACRTLFDPGEAAATVSCSGGLKPIREFGRRASPLAVPAPLRALDSSARPHGTFR